jgi:hypothetical protein
LPEWGFSARVWVNLEKVEEVKMKLNKPHVTFCRWQVDG